MLLAAQHTCGVTLNCAIDSSVNKSNGQKSRGSSNSWSSRRSMTMMQWRQSTRHLMQATVRPR